MPGPIIPINNDKTQRKKSWIQQPTQHPRLKLIIVK
jgi:hypothetical protein